MLPMAAQTDQHSRAAMIIDRLAEIYPEAVCSLVFTSPFELLVATILSAQCTDRRVNQVTPQLFARYPDAAALSRAPLEEIEELVRSTGFYHHKARHLRGAAQALVSQHGGGVPATRAELTALPGVGRKTANVILGSCFKIPAMVVDTHVSRLARRFGWTTAKDPLRIEADLCALLAEDDWVRAGHLLIYHGRAICKAPIPECSRCPIFALCPRQGVTRSR